MQSSFAAIAATESGDDLPVQVQPRPGLLRPVVDPQIAIGRGGTRPGTLESAGLKPSPEGRWS